MLAGNWIWLDHILILFQIVSYEVINRYHEVAAAVSRVVHQSDVESEAKVKFSRKLSAPLSAHIKTIIRMMPHCCPAYQ